MDTEELRINNWLTGFYNFVENENIELIPLYAARLHFLPQQDKEQTIKVAFAPLTEHHASKEQINQMLDVFETYSSQHEV